MEKWKKNYLKGILSDYPKMDQYIKEREKELMFPHKEIDVNSGYRSNKVSNKTELMAITISLDRRLANLERNQKIIGECLEQAPDKTREIVKELYMNPRKENNLDFVAGKVYLSTRQVTRLRDDFFEELADCLGI